MTTSEYRLVSQFYEGKKAERTGLPYMKHIDDGLAVLERIGASEMAKRAYCLHPVFQGDGDLLEVMSYPDHIDHLSVTAIVFAMEYRKVANSYLSKHYKGPDDDIRLSPLTDVNHMLIADKIQNFADFMKYHYGVHKDYGRLYWYFLNWHKTLEVDFEDFRGLFEEEKNV